MTSTCVSCGFQNRESVRFCEECGDELALVVHSEPDRAEPPESAQPPESGAGEDRRGRRARKPLFVGVGAAAAVALVAGGGYLLLSGDWGGDGGRGDSTQAVEEILTENVDLTDFDLRPNTGLEVVTPEGDAMEFSDEHVTLRTTDGDVTTSTALGTIAGAFVPSGDDFEFALRTDVPPATLEWAEWVLAGTPNLVDEGDVWTVSDIDRFAADLPSLEPLGGQWIMNQDTELPELIDLAELRFLYVVRSDGYLWAVDDVEQKIWLFVEGDDGARETAGALVEVARRAEFVAEEGLSATGQVNADAALAGLDAMLDAPVPQGPEGLRRAIGFSCGLCSSFKENVIDPGTKWVEQRYKTVESGVVMIGNGVYDYAAGSLTLDPDRMQDGLWQVIEGAVVATRVGDVVELITQATVKDCHRAGPGSFPDGSGRPLSLDEYYGTMLPELRTHGSVASDEWGQRALLAQAWMPNLQLSDNEKCGEIERITAKVYPYDADGNSTERLVNAATVQITYTVFFAEDGGIAKVMGVHPGDNEGFSVGLARSDETSDRCGLTDPHFELVGGKAAAHTRWPADGKVGGGLLRATSDSVGGSWNKGDPCPSIPVSWGEGLRAWDAMAPTASDDPYFIWSSENKHGTYFDETVCDVGLWKAEKCKGGRDLVDLHHWVEIVIPDLTAVFDADVGVPLAELLDPNADPADATCNDDGQLMAGGSLSTQSWPSGEDLIVHGSSEGNATAKSYFCLARSDDPQYEVAGIKTADHADFTPALEIKETENIPRPGELPEVEVPDLVGLTLSEAKRAADDVGLLAREIVGSRVELDPGDDRIGKVISQDPIPGTIVEAESIVTITIGTPRAEPDQVAVPDVIGDDENDATRTLRDLDLEIRVAGSVDVTSASGLDGVVADQDPPGGTMVDGGSTITVWIGAAPEMSTVPDLYGDTESAARSRLSNLGLSTVVAGYVTVDSETGLIGAVVDQDPSRGTSVPAGSTVRIWLGEGQDLVTVPCMEGELLADAVRDAEGVGLSVVVSEYVDTTSDPDADGRVTWQSSTCGTAVEPGTTLYVDVEDVTVADTFALRVVVRWWGPVDLDLDVDGPEQGVYGGDAAPSCTVEDSPPLDEHVETFTWMSAPVSGRYYIGISDYCLPSSGSWGGYEVVLEFDGGNAAGGWEDTIDGGGSWPSGGLDLWFDY